MSSLGGSPSEDGPPREGSNDDPYDPHDPYDEVPTFVLGRGQVPIIDPPLLPPEPARLAPLRPPARTRRRPRRRRSGNDWPVLAIALVISAVIMAGCCIAGLAVYSTT